MTSTKHTVTLHEGTTDVLQAMLQRVQESAKCVDTATDYDDLRHKLRGVVEQQQSLLAGLISRLASTEHYGDLHLAPELFTDHGLSLQWWHEAPETMHGGLNYHQSPKDECTGRWSVNT